MARYQNARFISKVAGTTFAASDIGKFLVINSSGHAVVPNTTGNVAPIGTLAGRTSTTSAAGSQAVEIAVDGEVQVQMAASTLSVGDWVASSTAGLGIAPSSDAYAWGIIVDGSSGAAGRVVSVLRNPQGPLNTP